ncbi:MAG: motility associated factor glycosyltransferase family protein [Spirochaetaceae bacterium]|nr:motility associated factor glycosyltransferase family protein [Spirochaetaceae bacterium]
MISFATAKNGSKTCIKDGFPLHSSYNPEKEAERFVAALDVPFEPSWIIITEPALSYPAQFLRQKFPNTKICAIRFCKDFIDYDKNWDKVFYFESSNLKDELFNFFGEEATGSLFFASWKPSENAFPDIYIEAWQNIKSYITLSRDVLGTRIYFNKRWNKNSLKFALYVKNVLDFKICKIDKPVVIVASGPSLERIIPYLKANRGSFFLLAVSSAVRPLIEQQLIPDAVISTDGGWYAQEHLKQLNFFKDIPLFISTESYLPAKMLQSNTIVPLSYKDSIEALLLEKAGIDAVKAERNGTVSGTAAELALQLSDEVFFCGLDLCSSNGFQHTQPNELELDKVPFDNRLSPLETRTALSTFASDSLSIYRNWFSTRPESFTSRVKRVYHSSAPLKFKLGNIEDIDEKAFENTLKKHAPKNAAYFDTVQFQNLQTSAERTKKLKDYFSELRNSFDGYYNSNKPAGNAPFELELWFKSLSLGDYLSLSQRHEKMSETMYNNLKDSLNGLEGILNRYDN